MIMTFARAIEVRRPMVRATNTGITSAILANGDILQVSPQIQPWAGVFEIQYKKSSPQTFFAIFPYIDVLFCILFIGIMILRKHYDRLQKP
jgi:apolipoprotein N-acyltransferase